MTINWINLAGICYAIVGASLFFKSVAFNPTRQTAAQVATAWNYNKHMVRPFVLARIEAVAGLGLLICGLLLQAVGVFVSGDAVLFCVAILFLLALFIAARLDMGLWLERGSKGVVDYLEGRRTESLAAKEAQKMLGVQNNHSLSN